MTTACSSIVSRAQAMSALNTPLTSDRAVMLSRIRADQQALFTSVAGLTRDYFQTTASVVSSVATSGRVLSLSALVVERVIRVDLSDGREASQVDVQDVEAELAPRYFVRGQTLMEVSNDWNTASSAAVSATVTYVYGPTDIDPDGALTQTVTVPDTFTDLLVIPLAMFLHNSDPGRDPAEYERLATMLDEKSTAFVSFLQNYGGVTSRRFDLPSPQSVKGQKK